MPPSVAGQPGRSGSVYVAELQSARDGGEAAAVALQYAIELRALTSVSGRLSRRYLRHEPVPAAAVRSPTKA
ncbi:hypothetical protein BJG92_03367 [Arthrobacter sp. SO5]|nr:hypothetical protein [Arthrobacter sp. SO5]